MNIYSYTSRVQSWMWAAIAILVLAIGGGVWLSRHDARVREGALTDARVSARDSIIDARDASLKVRDSLIGDLVRSVAERDIAYGKDHVVYVSSRDKLVAANPSNKPLIELAGKCDQLIISCDSLRAGFYHLDSTRSAQNDTLRAQERTLKDQAADLKRYRGLSSSRLVGSLAGSWDVLGKAPNGRAEVSFRTAGPLSAFAAGDFEPRRDSARAEWRIEQRILLGAKIEFR